MGSKIADELLREDLIKTNEKVEGKITKAEYNKIGEYSAATLLRRFGSFNKAKEAAGRNKKMSYNMFKLSQGGVTW